MLHPSPGQRLLRRAGRRLHQGALAPDDARGLRAARESARASARAWAACLKRVFEVYPVLCIKCGGEMKLVGVIFDDSELDRILAHQGWPVDFPKTSPARSPPASAFDENTADQADPSSEQWDARQDWPAGDWPA